VTLPVGVTVAVTVAMEPARKLAPAEVLLMAQMLRIAPKQVDVRGEIPQTVLLLPEVEAERTAKPAVLSAKPIARPSTELRRAQAAPAKPRAETERPRRVELPPGTPTRKELPTSQLARPELELHAEKARELVATRRLPELAVPAVELEQLELP
jgi:hypothetical protein